MIYDILLNCFLTWILFEIKLLQTTLKLPLFVKCSPVNVKESAEGLKKGVLKGLDKTFWGTADLHATLLKKKLWHRFFPVDFAKFLRTSFLIEHPRWLLLFRLKTFKIDLERTTMEMMPTQTLHSNYLIFSGQFLLNSNIKWWTIRFTKTYYHREFWNFC